MKKTIPGRENSIAKALRRACVWGEEGRMNTGRGDGEGRVAGNVTRKKLGSEMLRFLCKARNLNVSLKEVESSWKV